MSLFTEGKLFKRAGEGSGGGGDQHNLGWYATQSALETAHATATDGDFAIVGSTDTVWVWDSDTNAWKDTDTKGQVTSVNGQTGVVVLSIPDAVQYSTMPTAASTNEGDIVQFTGTTDANYTNGYFYKCVSDGGNPATYSWTAVSVQAGGSSLPDQTGHSGKFLTTDGIDASWATVNALQNTATRTDALTILGTASNKEKSLNIGVNSSIDGLFGTYGVAIGYGANASGAAVSCGMNAQATGQRSVSLGYGAETSALSSIQINASGSTKTNSDANTFKVANANGNFEIMSADGTIPEARLADTTNAAQGQVLTLDSNLNAVWQAGGGSSLPSQTGNSGKFLTTDGTDASWGNALEVIDSQNIYDAKLMVDGVYDSLLLGWERFNTAPGQGNVIVGSPNNQDTIQSSNSVFIGRSTVQNGGSYGQWNVCIGYSAEVTGNGSIMIGTGSNPNAGTFAVGIGDPMGTHATYEVLSADGTIPADRLASTTGLADGNYRLRLTMSNGTPTLTWVAE